MNTRKLTRGKLVFYLILIVTTIFSFIKISCINFDNNPTVGAIFSLVLGIFDGVIWLFVLIDYIAGN